MTQFLITYLHYDQKASRLAVAVWRHELMHTANPRVLRGGKTGMNYNWLLHWSTTECQSTFYMASPRFGNTAADPALVY